LNEIRTERK